MEIKGRRTVLHYDLEHCPESPTLFTTNQQTQLMFKGEILHNESKQIHKPHTRSEFIVTIAAIENTSFLNTVQQTAQYSTLRRHFPSHSITTLVLI